MFQQDSICFDRRAPDPIPEVPTENDDGIQTVADGHFEKKYYTGAEDTGEFLIKLSEQFGEDHKITISGEDWGLSFSFGELVKLDIEFEGDGEPELEIEVELAGRTEDDTHKIA